MVSNNNLIIHKILVEDWESDTKKDYYFVKQPLTITFVFFLNFK